MKKVLFVKQELLPKGGLEKYSSRLISAFVAQNCDVHILTGTKNTPPILGCTIEHVPLQSKSNAHKLLEWDAKTSLHAQKHPADLIFSLDRITCATHARAGNGVHAAFLEKKSRSFMQKLRSYFNWSNTPILRLERDLFTGAHLKKIFTNSFMVKHEIEKFYHIPSSKISVHHNGVEWKEMHHAFTHWETTQMAMKKTFGIQEGIPVFLFAGHHYKRKGLSYILKAFSKIQDAHLIVAGTDRRQKFYENQAERFGLKGRVSFIGASNSMDKLYALSDILVVPSLYDPFANVTIEALSMGLFVVSSPFNGGKEILYPSTGVVIEDLFDPLIVQNALELALKRPKTVSSAQKIRDTYASFDFSLKLPLLIQECLA